MCKCHTTYFTASKRGHGVTLMLIYLRKACEVRCNAQLMKCPYICSHSHVASLNNILMPLCSRLFQRFLSHVTFETIGEAVSAIALLRYLKQLHINNRSGRQSHAVSSCGFIRWRLWNDWGCYLDYINHIFISLSTVLQPLRTPSYPPQMMHCTSYTLLVWLLKVWRVSKHSTSSQSKFKKIKHSSCTPSLSSPLFFF